MDTPTDDLRATLKENKAAIAKLDGWIEGIQNKETLTQREESNLARWVAEKERVRESNDRITTQLGSIETAKAMPRGSQSWEEIAKEGYPLYSTFLAKYFRLWTPPEQYALYGSILAPSAFAIQMLRTERAVANFVENGTRHSLLIRVASNDAQILTNAEAMIKGFRIKAASGFSAPVLYLAWKYFTKKNPSPSYMTNSILIPKK